ncbi:MAG: ParA family protein [Sedimentisphaerales bacterium]
MIFAFYSYKGGVGRTLSLVHTGIALAAARRKKGYRVLLIDMDLEAPGLDIYVPKKSTTGKQGFAGLLRGYQENGRQAKWLEENIEDEQYISPIPGVENLFVMPAGIKAAWLEKGQEEQSYLDVVSDLTSEIPKTKHPSLPKDGFFRDIAEVLQKRFTYVLIDSRAGLAEQAYASTLLLADALVLCFRLNRANIEGIQTVLGNYLLREQTCLGASGVNVIPLATPVPPRGGVDVEKWISFATDAFVGKKDQAKDANDGKAQEPAKDESLFPPVQRIYFEPMLEIGENMVFNLDGSLKAAFDEQTPIVTCFQQLAERISALNANKDVVAARQLETQYYNKQGDYKKALEYLLKRIRLEPLVKEHWDDFEQGYSRKEDIREHSKTALANLIDEWRKAIDPGDLQKQPESAKRLAWALWIWTICFGKDRSDGGLSSIEECLGLSCGDEDIELNTHFLLGQVIDELVKERKSAKFIQEGMSESRLSIERANEHYSEAIKLSLKKYKKRGDALLFRARNMMELGKFKQALRDYDIRIMERTPKEEEEKLDDIHLTLLYEQGEVLKHEGWYDWAFRNYRTGLLRKPANEDILEELYRLAHRLELEKFGDEIGKLWEHRSPRSSKMRRIRAIVLMNRGEYKTALEENRIANLYSSRPVLGVLDAFINLLAGDFDTACDIMPSVLEAEREHVYTRAVYAIALALSGKKGALKFIDPHPDNSAETCVSAALACVELNVAKSALDCIKLKKASVQDVAHYQILLAAHTALSLKDNSKQIKAIKNLFDKRPLLPVVLGNIADVVLFRRIWEWLCKNGKLTKQNAESLNKIWRIIDKAKAPKLKDLPPRKLSERIPILKSSRGSKR